MGMWAPLSHVRSPPPDHRTILTAGLPSLLHWPWAGPLAWCSRLPLSGPLAREPLVQPCASPGCLAGMLVCMARAPASVSGGLAGLLSGRLSRPQSTLLGSLLEGVVPEAGSLCWLLCSERSTAGAGLGHPSGAHLSLRSLPWALGVDHAWPCPCPASRGRSGLSRRDGSMCPCTGLRGPQVRGCSGRACRVGLGVCAAVFSTLVPGLSSVASKLGLCPAFGLQGTTGRDSQNPPVSPIRGLPVYTRSLRGAALSQRGMWGGAAREGAPGLSRRPCGTHACGGWRITGVVRGLVGLACLCWRQGCPAVPRPVLPCRALQGGGSARGWAG